MCLSLVLVMLFSYLSTKILACPLHFHETVPIEILLVKINHSVIWSTTKLDPYSDGKCGTLLTLSELTQFMSAAHQTPKRIIQYLMLQIQNPLRYGRIGRAFVADLPCFPSLPKGARSEWPRGKKECKKGADGQKVQLRQGRAWQTNREEDETLRAMSSSSSC